MPYKYIEVEISRHDFLDLKRTIDIFSQFVKTVSGRIKGSNFNRYGTTRLSIRVNFDETDVEGIIINKAQELQCTGEIVNFSSKLNEWSEPKFVVTAHELGTLCAQELRNLFEVNSNVYQAFQEKRDHFMGHFIMSVMNNAGFKISPIWSILRETPIKKESVKNSFEEMAKQCAHIFNEKLNVTPDASFLERFVHSFINCTEPDTENTVIMWLFHTSLWQIISSTWKES